MLHGGKGRPVLGPSVSLGGRLFVPLLMRTRLGWGGGGVISGVPLALLIEEQGAWSFVPLADGIRQDILDDLEPLPPAG